MNDERSATLTYIGGRIAEYRRRGIGQEALQALGTLAGDLRAEKHMPQFAGIRIVENPLVGQHMAFRQQDEYFCSRCSKRWPVSEDAPEKCS